MHAESAERRFQIMQRRKEKLKDYAAFYSFPYDHVIVDEGQDFGRDGIENAKLLELLHDAVLADAESKASFYVFYDEAAVRSDGLGSEIHPECGMPSYPAQELQKHGKHMPETATSLSKKARKIRTFLLTAGAICRENSLPSFLRKMSDRPIRHWMKFSTV